MAKIYICVEDDGDEAFGEGDRDLLMFVRSVAKTAPLVPGISIHVLKIGCIPGGT